MRIVFMGTPDFAASSLKALIENGFDIVGVFTQPDKPRDRGMRPAFSPVKELALGSSLAVFQPEKLRDGAATELLRELRPDVLVVVAYGKLLPDDILALPTMGAINVHASLLPKYRGAAPIQWSVLNGDKTTGVTTMYLAHDMDAGDVIYTDETEIGEFETAGELFDRLADMGASLLVRTLRDMQRGTAPRTAQDAEKATYVKQLDKSICPIDWNKSPRDIVKHICGLDPWPVATMQLEGASFRVFSAEYTENRVDKAPGTLVSAGKRGIEIACADGATLLITELQAPGKKRVRASDWLLGHPISL
ncbi:MAG: methionyl-tRNA formyltransferase [Oscillospiraceae bacterium]